MAVFGREFKATSNRLVALHKDYHPRLTAEVISAHAAPAQMMERDEAMARARMAERLILQQGAERAFTPGAWERVRRTLARAEKGSIRVVGKVNEPAIEFRLASGFGRWKRGATVRLEFGTDTYFEQFHFSVPRPLQLPPYTYAYMASLHRLGAISFAYAQPVAQRVELPSPKDGAAAVGKLVSALLEKPNRKLVAEARARYLGKSTR